MSQFTDLITSEHKDKPNFVATVDGLTSPFSEILSVLSTMTTIFDVNTAEGQQLDYIAQWVGATRFVSLYNDIYFSWDTENVGWDQGTWWSPGPNISTVATLSDDELRTFIQAKIQCNSWRGSPEEVVDILTTLINDPTTTVTVFEDVMSVSYTVYGNVPPAIVGIIQGGYLPCRSLGVGRKYYFLDSNVTGNDFNGDIS